MSRLWDAALGIIEIPGKLERAFYIGLGVATILFLAIVATVWRRK